MADLTGREESIARDDVLKIARVAWNGKEMKTDIWWHYINSQEDRIQVEHNVQDRVRI